MTVARLWVLVTALVLALPATLAAEVLPPLQRGDVIFQNSRSEQSLAISLATKSPYTHVGIIDFDAAGRPVVLEAVRTMRATPLADWITYGEGEKVALYRLNDLTEAEALAVTDAARRHLGTPYDPFFHAGEDQLYCSELVFIAFRDGIGMELGKVQSLGELDLQSAEALALVGERWDSHPSCAKGQATDAADCLARILDAPLITPEAQAQDPRLTLVYSNFAP